MSAYFLVKWLHVLSSVVLVGTGFGTAYFMFFAIRSGNTEAQAVVTRLVYAPTGGSRHPRAYCNPPRGSSLYTC